MAPKTPYEELSDILDDNASLHFGYSNHMDVVLSKHDTIWQGMTDFETSNLLPNIESVLEEEDNILFLPLHVLDHTIGYAALVYEPDKMNMEQLYQFLMNVSTALETMKVHQRQQNIISSLENKYIHDPLTGLLNRRGFYQKVLPDFNRCINEEKHFIAISVDLNGLKKINDTYGHSDGDIAISAIGAQAFEEGLRGCLDEIFNPEIPFTQTPTGKACSYCPFKGICGK